MTEVIDSLRAALADRYAVQEELGRGGMATVYLAEDLKHHRQVAIKVLHPDLAAGLGAERFLREIETAARLHHPHILPLYDSGRTGGQADGRSEDFLYYVMPFVEGESLRDRLDREKQLPVEDALRITREVADALSYAHEHDVIHRDIKPDNIMLEGGHAMVADFGVARAITEAGGETLTSTGLAVGTPTYMSPEQAAAEKRLDGRSDLYSLGCLLYEMLAGEPPHTGATAQAILARRLSEPAPSLRAVRESVPEAVHQALARALARAPADRYSSVAKFVEALEQETQHVVGVRRTKRRGLISGVAVLAIIGLLLVSYLFIGADRFGAPTGDGSDAEPGVAVLPFQIVGDEIEFLHEGIVHLLSFNLDGVGGIRKIDPQAVLHAWAQAVGEDDAEPAPGTAMAVARHVGARYAITGSAVQLGPEVRLDAEVRDVDRAESRGSASVVGSADSVLALVDELTLKLLSLERIPVEEGDPQVNLSRVTTTSLPALKAYLAGEREYRRDRWEDAAREFRQAVELDSTFARAWYRLSWAYRWRNKPGGGEYAARAAALANGLPERDSLLLVGNAQKPYEAIQTFEFLTSRYPDDVDGWHRLGDRYFHHGGKALLPSSAFRNALRNAIDLSPQFGESYIHSIEDAFARRDSALAREYVDGLENPTCPGQAMIWDLVWGDTAAKAMAVATLNSTTLDKTRYLDCVWVTIAVAPRAYERIEPQHLEMLDQQYDWRARVGALWRIMHGRLMNGQIAAARKALASAAPLTSSRFHAAGWEVMLHLSGFADTIAAHRAAVVLAEKPGPFNDFWLGAIAVSEGRWEGVEQAARSIEAQDREVMTGEDSVEAPLAGSLAAGLRAYAAVMREGAGRLPEFEAAMRELPAPGFLVEQPQTFVRYMVGRMLYDMGDLRKAEQYFHSFYQYDGMYLVPAQYYLGRVYEALGRPDDAVQHYRLFVDWWRGADPELRPWWEEGRAALVRLSGEPRGAATP